MQHSLEMGTIVLATWLIAIVPIVIVFPEMEDGRAVKSEQLTDGYF